MKERNTDEQTKYTALQPEQSQQLSEQKPLCVPFPPAPCLVPADIPVNGYHVALPPREAYVWQRQGGAAAVRHMIAPVGVCAQCDEAPPIAASRNSWFCENCQNTLERFGQLPPEVN